MMRMPLDAFKPTWIYQGMIMRDKNGFVFSPDKVKVVTATSGSRYFRPDGQRKPLDIIAKVLEAQRLGLDVRYFYGNGADLKILIKFLNQRHGLPGVCATCNCRQ